MPDKKKFEPLIKPASKHTLQSKEVDIKDTMNFERRKVTPPPSDDAKKAELVEREKLAVRVRYRKRTMKTQKMSLDVLLKLDILDPFLRSTEEIEHDGKLSINDKIELLIESYLKAKLSTRQLEGYQAIYDNYLDTEPF